MVALIFSMAPAGWNYRSLSLARLAKCLITNVDLIAGPKAAVCLAITSLAMLRLSPMDTRCALSEEYIRALPSPSCIMAGCVGLARADCVEVKTGKGIQSGKVVGIMDLSNRDGSDIIVIQLANGAIEMYWGDIS